MNIHDTSPHDDPAEPSAQPEIGGSHQPPSVPEECTAVRGGQLLRAVEVMDALRAPEGDAWTHQQTHASLSRYLLEETHEVLDVLADPAAHQRTALADELGDLLFQILFHARVAQDHGAFDIDDVARAFVDKMLRRNPHVFGDRTEEALEDRGDVEQIIAQWHAVKAAEKAAQNTGDEGDHETAERAEAAAWFAGIPAELPALQTALKVVHRARSDGRLEELLEASRHAAAEEDAEDWGGAGARELLEAVVRFESVDRDPETALRTLLRRSRRILSERPGTAGPTTGTVGP